MDEDKLKKQEQRTKIAQELFDTEKTYINGLDILVKEFYTPLSCQSFTSKEQLKPIFSDIPVILGVNQMIKASLEERISAWSPQQLIGDIFIGAKGASYLKMYTQYINNHSRINSAIVECLKVKEFEQWLNERENVVGFTLDGLLISPVQRIPRYQMLLEQLLKYTWNSHPDYKNLVTAFESVKATAAYVNEKKRESEEREKTLQIYSKLTGKLKETMEYTPTRKFIKESDIHLLVSGSEKLRHLFLFNDLLVIGKPRKGLYSISQIEYLKNLVVKKTEDEASCDLQLSNQENSHTYTIRYKTPTDRLEWYILFDKKINEDKVIDSDLQDRISRADSGRIGSHDSLSKDDRRQSHKKIEKHDKHQMSQSARATLAHPEGDSQKQIEAKIKEEIDKLRNDMLIEINVKVEKFREQLVSDMEIRLSRRVIEIQRRLQTPNSVATERFATTDSIQIPSKRDVFDMWQQRAKTDLPSYVPEKKPSASAPTSQPQVSSQKNATTA